MHLMNPPFLSLHSRTVKEELQNRTVGTVSIILIYLVVFTFFAALAVILYLRFLENAADNSDGTDSPPPIRVFMSYRDLLRVDSGYGGSSSTSVATSPSHLPVPVSSSDEADNEGEEANLPSTA